MVIFATLILAACTTVHAQSDPQAASSTTPAALFNITGQNAGKTIRMVKGETFQVSLEGNPTTGYTWEWVAPEQPLLSQAGEPEFLPATDSLGSGGLIRLAFKAEVAGSQILKLIYHRTFEKDTPPLNTFEVNLLIAEN